MIGKRILASAILVSLTLGAVLLLGYIADEEHAPQVQRVRSALGMPSVTDPQDDEIQAHFEGQLSRARMYMRLMQLEQCRQTLTQAIELKPDSVQARELMVQCALLQLDSMLQKATPTSLGISAEIHDRWAQLADEHIEWLIKQNQSTGKYHVWRAELANMCAQVCSIQIASPSKARSNQKQITTLQEQLERCLATERISLERALERQPEHEQAQCMYLDMLVRRRKYDTLEAYLRQLSQADTLTIRTIETAVVAALSMPLTDTSDSSRVELAQLVLTTVSPKQARDVRVQLCQARVAIASGDLRHAEETLREILDRSPDDPDARQLLARCYTKQGNYDQAAKLLKVLYEQYPNTPDIANLYLAAIIQQQHAMTLGAPLRSLLGQADDDLSLARRLIELFNHMNTFDDAAGVLLQLVRSQPCDRTRFELIKSFAMRFDAMNDGVALLQKSEQWNLAFSRLAEAKLHQLQGQHEQALQRLSSAYDKLIIDDDPSCLEVADKMAAILATNNDLDKAILVYERLIPSERFRHHARLRCIQLAHLTGQIDTAVDQMQQLALIVDPSDPVIPEIADVFLEMDRDDLALQTVSRCLDARPTDPSLIRLSSQLLYKQSQLVRAHEALKRLSPDHWQAVDQRLLAQIHTSLNDFPQAQLAWREFITTYPDREAEALTALTRLYLKSDLTRRASTCLDRLMQQPMTSSETNRLAIGNLCAALHRTDQAVDAWSIVPDSSIDYGPAQLKLACHHADEDDQVKANAAIQNVTSWLKGPAAHARAIVEAAVELDPAHAPHRAILLTLVDDPNILLHDMPVELTNEWQALRANTLLHEGRWQEASAAFDDLARRSPGQLSSTIARIGILVHSHQLADARDAYRNHPSIALSPYGRWLALALELSPAAGAPTTPMIDVLEQLAHGQPEAAQLAAERLPASPVFFAADVEAFCQHDETKQDTTRAAHRRLALAMVAQQADQHEIAWLLMPEIVDACPASPLIQGFRAELMMADGRWPEGDLLDDLMLHLPSSTLCKLAFAEQAVAYGQIDAAMSEFQSVLRTEPGHPATIHRLAKLMHKNGRSSEALNLIEPLMADPACDQVSLARDYVAIQLAESPDQLMSARDVVERALRCEPNDPQLLHALGRIEHLQGHDQRALDLLLTARSAGMKPTPQWHAHVADVYASLGHESWSDWHRAEAGIITPPTSPPQTAPAPLTEHLRSDESAPLVRR